MRRRSPLGRKNTDEFAQMNHRRCPATANGPLVNIEKLGDSHLFPAVVEHQSNHFLLVVGEKIHCFVKSSPDVEVSGIRVDWFGDVEGWHSGVGQMGVKWNPDFPAEMPGEVKEFPAEMNGGEVEEVTGVGRTDGSKAPQESDQTSLENITRFRPGFDVWEPTAHLSGEFFQPLACSLKEFIGPPWVTSAPAVKIVVEGGGVERVRVRVGHRTGRVGYLCRENSNFKGGL